MHGICRLIEPSPFAKKGNPQSEWDESLSLAKVTLENLRAISFARDV